MQFLNFSVRILDVSYYLKILTTLQRLKLRLSVKFDSVTNINLKSV